MVKALGSTATQAVRINKTPCKGTKRSPGINMAKPVERPLPALQPQVQTLRADEVIEAPTPPLVVTDLDQALSLLDQRAAGAWNDQLAALKFIRQLAATSPLQLTPVFGRVIEMTLIAASSLRSGLAKEALEAVGDLIRCLPQELDAVASQVVPILVPKSVSDKKFLAVAAAQSCKALVGPNSAAVVRELTELARDKNAQVVLTSARLVHASLENGFDLGAAGDDVQQSMMSAWAGVLSLARRSESRDLADAILTKLRTVVSGEAFEELAANLPPREKIAVNSLVSSLEMSRSQMSSSSAGFREFLKTKRSAQLENSEHEK
eukprot:CAMPEP_0204259732 /NCGR_PEP_ID=MMETSP0468-20130131/5846_1 /ASSEMBLY_ACC=CAM_ASM_000383 /TAXON_ID=2969 /ORGANISM="Oxyrrhis marina" /LENGTH=320 /DNA_ID=CAMNT_0051234057 /DNA_START=26 /DNA_END=988 /DNA_ORIENTATION=-